MLIAALHRTTRAALIAATASAALTIGTPAFAQNANKPAQGAPAPADPGKPADAAKPGDAAKPAPNAPPEADGGAEVEPKQIPLNPKLVEAFISAWPEFEALREKLTAENPTEKDQDKNTKNEPESDEAEVGESEDPIGALAAYLDNPQAKPQIEAILKKHNFANYSDWADVAQSVLLAFGASDPDGGETDLTAEKKKVQSEIEGDAALSEDEKKSALKDLDEQFAALENYQPIPGNVDVVKPYLEKIKALFGDDQN